MYIVYLDARLDDFPNPRIELQLPTETRPVGSLAGATRTPLGLTPNPLLSARSIGPRNRIAGLFAVRSLPMLHG